MLSDTLSEKALSFTFRASEITCDVVISAINKLLQDRTKEKTGKQSIKTLRKKGNLQEIDITDETLKKLKKYLRKYNIDYSILKEKTEEKQYMLFFRTYDAEILEKVMTKFMQDRFKDKERTSIKEKINRIKQKSAQNTQEKKVKRIKKEERKAKYEEL